MGVHENSCDESSLQRIERHQTEVLLLVRNLAKRVAYLETQVGSSDSERTEEWRKSIEQSLCRLMQQHDWEAADSDDFKRKRFAELGYENILQLAYILPLERTLELWQQYAPSKPPATIEPEPRPHEGKTDRKLMRNLTGPVPRKKKNE